jgi:hypothetical protein
VAKKITRDQRRTRNRNLILPWAIVSRIGGDSFFTIEGTDGIFVTTTHNKLEVRAYNTATSRVCCFKLVDPKKLSLAWDRHLAMNTRTWLDAYGGSSSASPYWSQQNSILQQMYAAKIVATQQAQGSSHGLPANWLKNSGAIVTPPPRSNWNIYDAGNCPWVGPKK